MEGPGHLPWWRLGRPRRSEEEDPETAGPAKREEAAGRQGRGRTRLEAEDFVGRAVQAPGADVEEPRGRSKRRDLSRARELPAVFGVKRYSLRVKDLADLLGKHPVTVTARVMRSVRRRVEDAETAARLVKTRRSDQ